MVSIFTSGIFEVITKRKVFKKINLERRNRKVDCPMTVDSLPYVWWVVYYRMYLLALPTFHLFDLLRLCLHNGNREIL